MKKLKLKLSNFAGSQDEVLTRSQLKAILGRMLAKGVLTASFVINNCFRRLLNSLLFAL